MHRSRTSKTENKIDGNNTGRWGETKKQIRETERDRERERGRRRQRERCSK